MLEQILSVVATVNIFKGILIICSVTALCFVFNSMLHFKKSGYTPNGKIKFNKMEWFLIFGLSITMSGVFISPFAIIKSNEKLDTLKAEYVTSIMDKEDLKVTKIVELVEVPNAKCSLFDYDVVTTKCYNLTAETDKGTENFTYPITNLADVVNATEISIIKAFVEQEYLNENLLEKEYIVKLDFK